MKKCENENCNNNARISKDGKRYLRTCSVKCQHEFIYSNMTSEAKSKFHNNGNTKYFDRLKQEGRFKEHQKKASNKFWGDFTEEEKSKYIQGNLDKMVKQRKILTINGVTFNNLQGYEDKAILYLVSKENIDVKKIKAKPKHIRLLNGKIHYPDLKIGKTYIEVKSDYTFSLDKNLDLKIKSAIAQGFNYRVMVFSSSHLLKDSFYNSLWSNDSWLT